MGFYFIHNVNSLQSLWEKGDGGYMIDSGFYFIHNTIQAVNSLQSLWEKGDGG